MAMQGYGTAPSRNTVNAASAPKKKGLIEKEMMSPMMTPPKKMMNKKEMPMAKPSTVKKIAKKRAKKAKR